MNKIIKNHVLKIQWQGKDQTNDQGELKGVALKLYPPS